MSDRHQINEDEIDLKEIVAALWSHKILIILTMVIFIVFGGYQITSTEKKFTATAVFQIEQEDKSGFNLSSELGALASLAGINRNSSSSLGVLLERIEAREFILEISRRHLLSNDPFFNTPLPEKSDPLWKSTIKKIIGWEQLKVDKNLITENNIITAYNKFVKTEETDGGAISISVTHEVPQLAAEYANKFMEDIRGLVELESNTAQQFRLAYLSETLADALQEMETAQQNLKQYALQNSAMAEENFISGSLKLDELRMEKRKVEEISNVLEIIFDIVKTRNYDNNSYQSLRLAYPLVDDLDFRRILGMSETISAWNWPTSDTIEAVSATLRDRLNRLEIEINTIEDNAKIYASSAEDLAKFTRDAKIAEATYTVLIEQVKSQALAAGFQPDTFKVFQYATTPLSPSSPRRNLILLISAVLGLFAGSLLALLNFTRRGVFHTKASIEASAQAKLTLKARPFKKLSQRPINEISSYLSKQRIVEIDEAQIKISNKKIVYILNCGGRSTASETARILSIHSSESGRKVILCDQAGVSDKVIEEKPIVEFSGLSIVNLDDNLSLLKGENGASFFTSANFNSTIEKLMLKFDQVFICSNKSEYTLGLYALDKFDPSVVVLARLRGTQKADIKRIKENQPIDVLFYD